MPKPTFSGDRVVERHSRHAGIRTYVNPNAYDPTPPKERPDFAISPVLIRSSLIAVAVIGVLWLFFLSPFFKISTIEIRGEAKPETVATINELKGKNIFLIGGKKAEQSIAHKQPGIKKIKLLRGIPSTVIVELVERDPAVVWTTNDKQYLVDKDGIIFKEGLVDLPNVRDGKNLPVNLGDRISSPSFVVFIKRLVIDLPKNTNLNVKNITVPETTFQVEVQTDNGPVLKIDTSRSLNEQLVDIKYVLDNNKDAAKNLIDVRVQGFAYIR